MDVAGGGGGGGGGGPAPFLLKTYEMVDDPATDGIVSWSATKKSFIVWKALDFSAQLLPIYFKHNNFSSFIRQLNTYGFHKSDPERWEFANEDFVKGRKDLLKNIHRRKPIHSHSYPPGGGLPEAERTALEEEIDRLNREKTLLHSSLWKFKQQHSGTKIQLEDLERRLTDMEQRQVRMVVFMQRASQNPRFMYSLLKMTTDSSMDLSLMQKKRSFSPGADYCWEASENGLSRTSSGHMLDEEICDKLKLELCSAMQDSNVVTATNQMSNEDTEGSRVKETSLVTVQCLQSVSETLQLSDTRASICPNKNLLFPAEVIEEDALFPCQLSLTLASSAMQLERSDYSGKTSNSVDQGTAYLIESSAKTTTAEYDVSIVAGKESIAASIARTTSSQEAATAGNEAPLIRPGRVNDVFWEQFLTERPGSTEAEEATYRSDTNTSVEKNKGENANTWRNKTDMEQLKL